jgi:hypothetical protein
MNRGVRRLVALPLVVFLTCTVVACGGSSSGMQPELEYKPIILPVKFVVGVDGVEMSGESSIVTPVGVFTLNAGYNLSRPQNSTYVVIRNRRQRPAPADNVFRVRAGGDRLDAVVDGHTEVAVKDGWVMIDVSGAKVRVIQLQQTRVVSADAGPAGVALWWHNGLSRWNAGYDRPPYKPFMLTRWAFDDATLGKYYGLGFLWFLLRLALAILLFVVDLALTLVFLIAQFFNYFFGPTGANIVWGVFLLIILYVTARSVPQGWRARIGTSLRRRMASLGRDQR